GPLVICVFFFLPFFFSLLFSFQPGTEEREGGAGAPVVERPRRRRLSVIPRIKHPGRVEEGRGREEDDRNGGDKSTAPATKEGGCGGWFRRGKRGERGKNGFAGGRQIDGEEIDRWRRRPDLAGEREFEELGFGEGNGVSLAIYRQGEAVE
uniref:Uncharacterized protein n=1 Tax=Oryza glumipatula TaxID=40148 RepID=A0A0E0AIK1_9ORYZ